MLSYLTLILAVIVNISLLAILMRLEVKHKVFSSLQAGASINRCMDKLAGLMEFILTRKYAKLKDPVLTVYCLIFILSFLAALPMMVVTIIFHD